MAECGWRSMVAEDVAAVTRLSDMVHGRYTERAEVYAERLALYPTGCFLFEREGKAAGYLICHPWRRDRPVPLDTLVGKLPTDADCFYLHDLALLPIARGTGAGKRATETVLTAARTAGFGEVRLVAVNGAESFWAGRGFALVPGDEGNGPSEGYGAEALAMRLVLPA